MRRAGAGRPRGTWRVALTTMLAVGCAEPAVDPPEPIRPAEGVYGRVTPAVGGVPSVVLLTPHDPADESGLHEARVDQLGLQFAPRFLVAAVGVPILLKNSESIAHNVIVRSQATGEILLNADTPSGGEALLEIADEGAYDLQCEIHPGMSGVLYVTSAPYGAFAEQDGSFAMTGIPDGAYRLEVWSLDPANVAEREVRIIDGIATEVATVPLG